MWFAALVGCAYRLVLTSAPAPATVTLPGGDQVVTPATVPLRWVPFGRQQVTVIAPGHRALSVDLRDREIRLGRWLATSLFRPATLTGRPRGEVRFVLIPEHGPSGTWTEEEVP